MKKFLKTFGLLMLGMFVLVSGIDSALDRVSSLPQHSCYTIYNEKGDVVIDYVGDLSLCKVYAKPVTTVRTEFVHRT